ncbi:helix-turn-helix domain-containing protein [Pseudomonadota bacterium]
MRTLDLKAAAAFLHMSPATLRQRAKTGMIPGAKPGKRWVFIESDLVAYLQTLYSGTVQAPLSDCDEGNTLCHSTNAAIPGGFASQRPMASEYAALLGLKTSNSRRNTTTS